MSGARTLRIETEREPGGRVCLSMRGQGLNATIRTHTHEAGALAALLLLASAPDTESETTLTADLRAEVIL